MVGPYQLIQYWLILPYQVTRYSCGGGLCFDAGRVRVWEEVYCLLTQNQSPSCHHFALWSSEHRSQWSLWHTRNVRVSGSEPLTYLHPCWKVPRLPNNKKHRWKTHTLWWNLIIVARKAWGSPAHYLHWEADPVRLSHRMANYETLRYQLKT